MLGKRKQKEEKHAHRQPHEQVLKRVDPDPAHDFEEKERDKCEYYEEDSVLHGPHCLVVVVYR